MTVIPALQKRRLEDWEYKVIIFCRVGDFSTWRWQVSDSCVINQ